MCVFRVEMGTDFLDDPLIDGWFSNLGNTTCKNIISHVAQWAQITTIFFSGKNAHFCLDGPDQNLIQIPLDSWEL